MSVRLICGDAIRELDKLENFSVQTIVTSPPYWALRDYQNKKQLGSESTPDRYIKRLVNVFAAARRVLRDDGTLWLVLGDTYSSGRKGSGGPSRKQNRNKGSRFPSVKLDPSVPAKNLLGIPWRVALALQADGWIVRSEIIWSKPNPMPASVKDRPTVQHETVFLLSKKPKYFYSADAIREPAQGSHTRGANRSLIKERNDNDRNLLSPHPLGRNKRSVWTVTPKAYKGAHFATFPPALVKPMILAGSKEGDTVLDPFCGSGTTGFVALQHGRDFIGIDVNESYLTLARNRLAA